VPTTTRPEQELKSTPQKRTQEISTTHKARAKEVTRGVSSVAAPEMMAQSVETIAPLQTKITIFNKEANDEVLYVVGSDITR